MLNTKFSSDLNESQLEAVTYCDGPSLVIAGAGSGKTRVLTYKIAYLLQHGFQPWNILALTFTNKAAREMNTRISTICEEGNMQGLWSGTFHSIFARMLRMEYSVIQYPQNFTIYDSADTKSLIKTIVKELKLDEKIYKPNVVASRISEAKNHLIVPSVYAADNSIRNRDGSESLGEVHRIYTIYQHRLYAAGAMDFDDLLLNTFLMLRDNADVRERYVKRFQYILVDEYQDTNMAQHRILSLLTTPDSRICVVGDDAQSIYGFRGADITNILTFQEQYPQARIIKLECNYRSTQNIVEAANCIIRNNVGQIPKKVYSAGEKGEPIHLFSATTDKEEARKVVSHIVGLHKRKQLPYNEIAVLYRTNAQSRVIEECLQSNNIPYKIYGGLSFYQRKEIKDVIAYCRLVTNPHDEEAFRRIINYPARGIGATTIQKLQNAAAEHGVSMWTVATNPMQYELAVNKGAQTKIASFCELIQSFRIQSETTTASVLVKDIVRRSGIALEFTRERSVENTARQENVDELLGSIQSLEKEAFDEEGKKRIALEEFLSTVSLLSDADSEDDGSPRVTLMTVHAAKGLEFQAVFVTGMEDELFPNANAHLYRKEMEEERRLFYVAVTRAKEYCFLSYANTRYRYGNLQFAEPSSFLSEIEGQYLLREDDSSKTSRMSGGNDVSSPFSRSNGSAYSRSQSNNFNDFFGTPSEDEFRASMGLGSRIRENEGYYHSGTTAKGGEDYGYSSHRSYNRTHESNVPKCVPPVTPPSGFIKTSIRKKVVTHSAEPTDASAALSKSILGLDPGRRVAHARFGEGKIISVEGNGDSAKVKVNFDQVGVKNLLVKFAKLTLL